MENNQVLKISNNLKADSAAIKSVIEVESNGNGFRSDGRPKILFEGHKFWEELVKCGIKDPSKYTKGNENILYEKWSTAFYSEKQYDRLFKAAKLSMELTKSQDAAFKSASWGAFQIMGSNHVAAGYPDVTSFVIAQQSSEGQIKSFLNFVKSDHRKLKALLDKNWAEFARLYNGKAYKKNNYDVKLKSSYDKHISREDKQGGGFFRDSKLILP
jgi:hypothetical protein